MSAKLKGSGVLSDISYHMEQVKNVITAFDLS